MQSHFNETFESLGDGGFDLPILAILGASAALTVTFLAVSILVQSKGLAKKAFVAALAVAIIGAASSVGGIYATVTGASDNISERGERPAAVRQLVVETLKPTFEDENVAALKVLPVGTTGSQDIPELRISASTGEPEFVFSGTASNFHDLNMSAWANDLSEGDKPTVQVLYQDGKIETLEAGFNSDGDFTLSSSE